MKIGEIINTYRTENGLSMDEFAERSTLSKGYISMLEKGINPRNNKPIIPSLPTIAKVAGGMGKPFDEVFNMLDKTQQIEIGNHVAHDQPSTIAAHHDKENWTKEELEEIEAFKAFVISKRNNE